jgi:hypothetical protein
VLALREVQTGVKAPARPVAWIVEPTGKRCEPGPGDLCAEPEDAEILSGTEEKGERYAELRFLVSLEDGSIDVDAGFQLHEWPTPRRMRYAAWSRANARRLSAVGIVRALPEIVAWRQQLDGQSTPAMPLAMALWTEHYPGPDCTSADDDCAFQFYVGENHIGSHSVRWHTVRVYLDAHKITVGDAIHWEPYDTWKETHPVKGSRDGNRLEGPLPAARGEGDLGYGAPNHVVEDATRWSHPVKAALAEHGFVVRRVELYLGGTYPALFIAPAPGQPTVFERAAKDPWPVRLAAHELLEANGGYAFELVEDAPGGRSRYRFRGRDRTLSRLVGAAWKAL